jgi:UDP-GlcNAc:undecaprenyl-phosphate GlcNAc-1-phosphate transferase
MIFLTLVVSFIIVLSITPLMMRVASRFNFLDYPEQRKLHLKPTPLLGGVGVFFGFWSGLVVSLLFSHISRGSEIMGLFLGSLAVIGLGLVDDKKGMNPSIKFSGQITASLIFIFFSGSSGIFSGGLWDTLILLVWMVGLMNALNFLDNMDGLCSGISVIVALAFFVLAYFTSNTILLLISLALTGALLGFLKYNFSPAKIFLGDTGSMLCGFILSAMGIVFAKQGPSHLNQLLPVLILSYPIFDISFVTFTRLKEGRRFYQGGRDHSSHRIMEMGIHPKWTVLGIYSICLALAAMGVVTFFFLESPLKVLVIAFAVFLLTIFGVHLHRNFAHIKQKAILVLVDVLTINLLFLFVYWLRFQSKLFPVQIVVPLAEYTAPAIWITLFWINLFAVLGLYDFDWDASLKEMWRSIFKSVGLGVVIFVILTLSPDYLLLRTWTILGIYAVSLTFLLIAERSLLVFWFRSLLSWEGVKRKAVIVGTGDNAQKVLQDVNSNIGSGYQIVGFVKDIPGDKEVRVNQLQVLGNIDDLSEILKEHKVHEVLIALESERDSLVGDIINRVSGIEVNFKLPAELSGLARGCKTSKLYRGKFLKVHPQPMRAWEWGLKRLWDIVISFLVLLFLSPILLLTWFVLKLKFKSSALVEKSYLGKSRKGFKVYKFRLNSQDEEDLPPQTNIESFLRRTRIERLPMLFSVLKGEMSFAGPHPVWVKESGDLSINFLSCSSSFNVKPGIWSLSYLAKEDLKKETAKMENDIFYMENMSLWLDAKIFSKGMNSLIKRILTNH